MSLDDGPFSCQIKAVLKVGTYLFNFLLVVLECLYYDLDDSKQLQFFLELINEIFVC